MGVTDRVELVELRQTNREDINMPKKGQTVKDLTGQVFGTYEVLQHNATCKVGTTGGRAYKHIVRCIECGTMTTKHGVSLTPSGDRSCVACPCTIQPKKVCVRIQSAVRYYTPATHQVGLTLNGWFLKEYRIKGDSFLATCVECSAERILSSTKGVMGGSCKRTALEESLPKDGEIIEGIVVCTRASAEKAGLKLFYTGVACSKGHYSGRQISGNCVVCSRLSYEANKDKIIAQSKAWAIANPKRAKELRDNRYKNNRDKIIAQASKWQRDNPERTNQRNVKRREMIVEATPPWVDDVMSQQMKDLYKESAALQVSTGEKYHVDHIIPIQSKVVCGLHVPWNLRIVTAEVNQSKSNSIQEDL